MSARFEKAIAAFDAYHKKDPETALEQGKPVQKELLYAQRMTARLSTFAPDADEAVQLAARSQHIGRWEIPREDYPMDRKGYLQWRNDEKSHHAAIADKILSECEYDAATIKKVKHLILKKELYSNPDSQLLEDVVCLVFLEFYVEEFAAKHIDEKVSDILRKTLRKMSPRGKEAASHLPLSPKVASLMHRAGS